MSVDRKRDAKMTVDSRLDRPHGTYPVRIEWLNAGALVTYHLIAALAFFPWFFSWSALIVGIVGIYAFGTLGINLCFHRLLTHRGLKCPPWLERTFAILGVCSFQDTPARWAAVHRRHHEHSDEQADPHSPRAGFWWAHLQWIYVENRELGRLGIYDRYAKDILRDKFYVGLERRQNWLKIILVSWLLFFIFGASIALIAGDGWEEALRMGASLLVWGVFVRTVVVWHITWSVNSLAHISGYRNYETNDLSRNNFIVGVVSNGEGWHNNHHADPRSARHGHRSWEFDVTWLTIVLLERVGLAKDVVRPAQRLLAQAGLPVMHPSAGRLRESDG